jgi:hypothetical protein
MSVSSFSGRFDSLMQNSMFADEVSVQKVQTAIKKRLKATPLDSATAEAAEQVLSDISRDVSGLKAKKYLQLKREIRQLIHEERSRITEAFEQAGPVSRKRGREEESRETRQAKKPKLAETASSSSDKGLLGKNLELALRKIGIPENDIQKIRDGYLSNWEGFVKSDDIYPELLQQTHRIKNLKVYKDPSTGRLLADYGIEYIGKGTFKRVKSGFRILSEGALDPFVRYTVTEKKPAQRKRFLTDIKKELDIRDQLGPIPYLLGVKKIQYVNRSGILKNRYVSEKCNSDVYAMVYDPKAEGVELLPIDARQVSLAKKCCRDALEALGSLHAKGFVHLDVKPENILSKNGEGRLADLGFACKANIETQFFGTPAYFSPELLLARSEKRNILSDPKMDMYAFGMTLLMIVKPELAQGLLNAQYEAQDADWAKEKIVQFDSVLDVVRDTLVKSSDPMDQLLAAMLDPDHQTRIDSQQALAAFNAILGER